MKLLILISLLISSMTFAQDVKKPTSTGTLSHGATHFNHTKINLTVEDRGWRADGTLEPVYNVTSVKKFLLSYDFKALSTTENTNVEQYINDYYENLCGDYAELEFQPVRTSFGNLRGYELSEYSDLSTLNSSTYETDEGLDTWGIFECKVTVNLREI